MKFSMVWCRMCRTKRPYYEQKTFVCFIQSRTVSASVPLEAPAPAIFRRARPHRPVVHPGIIHEASRL